MITMLVFQLQESKAKQIKSHKHLEISHIRLYKLGMQANTYSIQDRGCNRKSVTLRSVGDLCIYQIQIDVEEIVCVELKGLRGSCIYMLRRGEGRKSSKEFLLKVCTHKNE